MKLSDLPNLSRVWVYQANRLLNESEVEEIYESGLNFISNWSAHGADLKSAIEVKHNLFVILAIDEQVAGATGCSIDKSVHFIKSLGSKLNVDFFNRLNIAYLLNDKIELVPMSDFQDFLKSGKLDGQTTVYNNLVENLGEFHAKWEGPVNGSWHKQLI
ncbi:MAG: ABC transporter ATPase [Salibacteraceae bacterium]